MKQCYPMVPILKAFFVLIFYLPTQINAQCLCSDGSAPHTVQHSLSTSFMSNKTTIFSMPKFDPATGTLVCVNAKAYVTSVLRMKLENDAPNPITYRIKYTRWDTVVGPGINPDVTGNLVKYYGMYPLDGSDGNVWSGPDFVSVGPDTIYKQKLFEGTTSDVTGYMGTGSVDFTYRTGALAYPDIGGDYVLFSSFPLNKVEFFMTYSYCNTAVLPLGIQNFQASLKDKDNITLSWKTLNDTKNNNYEIEFSQDAAVFRTIGAIPSRFAEGASTEYEYQYHLNQPVGGKLYFRIRQKTNGVTKYSMIRSVDLGAEKYGGIRIYPNPVVQKITMEFETPLSGDHIIELSNQVGQIIYSTRMRFNNNKAFQVDIDNSPPPGVYYLRVRSQGSGKVYSGKLLFQQ